MSSASETLRKLLRSEISGDLLTLFHKNPGLLDTQEGVARRIGRLATTIEADVANLADIGVLSKKRIGNAEILYLNRQRDKELQESIANYLKSLKKDA
jgi:predicted transcriptional regulator